MSNLSMNIHSAKKVSARRVCINGAWQLQLTVELQDDSEFSFAIFAYTREALELGWDEDEHCRITGEEAIVERQSVPFC